MLLCQNRELNTQLKCCIAFLPTWVSSSALYLDSLSCTSHHNSLGGVRRSIQDPIVLDPNITRSSWDSNYAWSCIGGSGECPSLTLGITGLQSRAMEQRTGFNAGLWGWDFVYIPLCHSVRTTMPISLIYPANGEVEKVSHVNTSDAFILVRKKTPS